MLRIIKSEKGFGMIMTMIVVFVATVLGVTLYQVGTKDVMSVERDENIAQAYYYARSGVEVAIGLIMENINQNEDYQPTGEYLYGKLGDESFSNQSTDDYNIKFKIMRDEDEDPSNDNFYIESIGIVRQGGAEGAQIAANDLGFVISLENLRKGNAGGVGGDGGSGEPLALFSSEGIKFTGSAGISGHVITNTEVAKTVEFNNDKVFIKDGDLYIGPNADKKKVIFYGGGGAEKKNIPDGSILKLGEIRQFPLPDFPDPSVKLDLPYKGTLTTNQGAISGRVYTTDGVGVDGVKIYISPSIPGNIAKTSVITNNGKWASYAGNDNDPGKQMGTVIITPIKAGYDFNPQSIKVTGPHSEINFIATPNANTKVTMLEDPNLKWGYEIEQGDYDEIRVTDSRRIYIDMKRGTRVVRVNKLSIEQGNIDLANVSDNGKLIFIVNETFTLTGSSKVNDGGAVDNVVMYYKGSKDISAAGSTKFVGSVFVETAKITGGGCVGFVGDIISKGNNISYLEWTNNEPYPRIIYAPNAYLDMSNGSGRTKGTVIVRKCDLGGGGSPNNPRILSNNELDTRFFNSLIWSEDPPSLLTKGTVQEELVDNNWRVRGQWSN